METGLHDAGPILGCLLRRHQGLLINQATGQITRRQALLLSLLTYSLSGLFRRDRRPLHILLASHKQLERKYTRNSEEVKLAVIVTTPRDTLFDFSAGGVDTIQSQTFTKCCYLGIIIREHPWENWILHEIIVRAAC